MVAKQPCCSGTVRLDLVGEPAQIHGVEAIAWDVADGDLAGDDTWDADGVVAAVVDGSAAPLTCPHSLEGTQQVGSRQREETHLTGPYQSCYTGVTMSVRSSHHLYAWRHPLLSGAGCLWLHS